MLFDLLYVSLSEHGHWNQHRKLSIWTLLSSNKKNAVIRKDVGVYFSLDIGLEGLQPRRQQGWGAGGLFFFSKHRITTRELYLYYVRALVNGLIKARAWYARYYRCARGSATDASNSVSIAYICTRQGLQGDSVCLNCLYSRSVRTYTALCRSISIILQHFS